MVIHLLPKKIAYKAVLFFLIPGFFAALPVIDTILIATIRY